MTNPGSNSGTRREFIKEITLATVAVSAPGRLTTATASSAIVLAGAAPFAGSLSLPASRFIDLLRAPDALFVQTSTGSVVLQSEGNGQWTMDRQRYRSFHARKHWCTTGCIFLTRVCSQATAPALAQQHQQYAPHTRRCMGAGVWPEQNAAWTIPALASALRQREVSGNKQWLELLSRSGSMTFGLLAPDALGG